MSDASSDPELSPKTMPSNGDRRRYAWSPPTAVGLILGTFLIVPSVVQIALMALPAILGWSAEHIDTWTTTSPLANFLFVLCTEILTIGIIFAFVRRRHMSFRAAAGLGGLRWRDLGYTILGLLVYFGIFVIAFAVTTSLLPIDTSQQQDLGFSHHVTGSGLWLAFAGLVILPPIAEEIAFRGFLYGTFRGNGARKWVAILVTSVVFAALHLFGGSSGGLLWAAFIDIFALSLVLCYLREHTGTIWASIGVHALKNAFVFVNLFIIHGR